MSGHRPFSDLKKGWNSERLAANAARKAKLTAEMVSLEQLREGLGISQEDWRTSWRCSSRPSRSCPRPDMKVSTLRD